MLPIDPSHCRRHGHQATALKLIGDVVFLLNLYLWINTAVTASLFTLTPTLAYNNASEQVSFTVQYSTARQLVACNPLAGT